MSCQKFFAATSPAASFPGQDAALWTNHKTCPAFLLQTVNSAPVFLQKVQGLGGACDNVPHVVECSATSLLIFLWFAPLHGAGTGCFRGWNVLFNKPVTFYSQELCCLHQSYQGPSSTPIQQLFPFQSIAASYPPAIQMRIVIVVYVYLQTSCNSMYIIIYIYMIFWYSQIASLEIFWNTWAI